MVLRESFLELPYNNRVTIFNAGCKVFANYSYKKASMSKAAVEAGISKSLLFYYFKNKKEYYLFIVNQVLNQQHKFITDTIINQKPYDLFSIIIDITKVKRVFYDKFNVYYKLLKRMFFESEAELQDDLKLIKKKQTLLYNELLNSIDVHKFKNKKEVSNCFKTLLYCGEGVLANHPIETDTDINAVIDEYTNIIYSLKLHYYCEE